MRAKILSLSRKCPVYEEKRKINREININTICPRSSDPFYIVTTRWIECWTPLGFIINVIEIENRKR